MNNRAKVNSMISAQGFSLIELMITVAIVGILASVAYPSYTEHVRKSKRAAVQSDMLQLANAIERVYTVRGSYATVAVDSDGVDANLNDASDIVYKDYAPSDGDRANRLYDLTVTSLPAACVAGACQQYNIQAVRVIGSSMATDKCGDFQVSNTGAKSISNYESGYTLDRCWKQ